MDRELIARLHQTKEDIPENGIVIDATAPIARVVDEIVGQSEAISQSSTAVTAVIPGNVRPEYCSHLDRSNMPGWPHDS